MTTCAPILECVATSCDEHSTESGLASVAVVAEARYLAQREPAALVEALERHGIAPRVVDPQDEAATRAVEGVRLAVARGRSPALLSLLAALEARGVATLNRSAAIAAVVDKAAMAERLRAAGLPTPPTLAGSPDEIARACERGPFPLVVKPALGDNARGVVVVRDRRALASLPHTERVLAQPFVEGDGRDLKLYVAAGHVWAARKASPVLDPGWKERAAEPIATTPRMRALALACGELFGLEAFGVDCVLAPSGPIVIEVNDFPNYSGLPEADDRLARAIVERVRAPQVAR
jgi:glutathione synthase/RimK-type ligase-like ATP-grasp enzyme